MRRARAHAIHVGNGTKWYVERPTKAAFHSLHMPSAPIATATTPKTAPQPLRLLESEPSKGREYTPGAGIVVSGTGEKLTMSPMPRVRCLATLGEVAASDATSAA